MKRFMLFVVCLYLFVYPPTNVAAGSDSARSPTVYDSIQNGEEAPASPDPAIAGDSQSSALIPLYIKFIVSFILVVGLLLLLLRFLSKRSRLLNMNGPIVPLGGHGLGEKRSLQVLLIGQTIYIVGVGEDVTLIRSISEGEEFQHLLKEYENKPEGWPAKKLPSGNEKSWSNVFREHLNQIRKTNGGE